MFLIISYSKDIALKIPNQKHVLFTNIPVFGILSPKAWMNPPFGFSDSLQLFLKIDNYSGEKWCPNIELVSLVISLSNLGGKHSLTL